MVEPTPYTVAAGHTIMLLDVHSNAHAFGAGEVLGLDGATLYRWFVPHEGQDPEKWVALGDDDGRIAAWVESGAVAGPPEPEPEPATPLTVTPLGDTHSEGPITFSPELPS